jgi:hypothetical protein
MKHTTILLAFVATFSAVTAKESKEEFKSEVIRIINEQDWDGYKAITFKEGMTGYDQKMMETMKPVIFDGQKVISGSFGVLPIDHKNTFIYDDRQFSLTLIPEGLLELKQENGGATTLQYARVDKEYALVTTKSKDLKWDGPDDVPLSIMIIGHDHEDLKIEASWNVSGASVTEKLNYMSTNFNGQYIEKVTILSDDPDAAYQLKILQAGIEIFDSKPRKGVGEIKYKRDVNPEVTY